MECLIGLTGKDFVIVAADTNQAHSIVVLKNDDEKLFKLSKTTAMLVAGEPGDKIQFSEYIQKNLQLYKMINGYELSTKSAVHFTRRELAQSLRSQNPYNVNILIAGYDKLEGPTLYFIDYLSSAIKTPFAIHGYGQYFGLSICDRYYKDDMNEEEAVNLLRMIITEVQKRFLVSLPQFKVRIINKEGIKDIELNLKSPSFEIRTESMDTH